MKTRIRILLCLGIVSSLFILSGCPSTTGSEEPTDGTISVTLVDARGGNTFFARVFESGSDPDTDTPLGSLRVPVSATGDGSENSGTIENSGSNVIFEPGEYGVYAFVDWNGSETPDLNEYETDGLVTVRVDGNTAVRIDFDDMVTIQ